ncbi:MAG: 23S rRNA (guanosine(2251)-2'-O)-methyltransferase RlmB [Ruminococcus sp.]|nr:23S rRNA (guanosine(2251)-2'-O)-methyltransferase RlmB [Oscillospiraceae bacterium]MDD6270555.1 23S rRNA (guanosine(2251)-2'-O)-methyltransferase RlmB [Ruminococcus sp.]MDD7344226.1 23S rRNA (guanosine(2251)-2'-O)-methyltransferase RlmB [Ruminococcus sp.]MDY6058725.1 23S rRNA (guanosine(2251)-2'-O)-methyltransferase RlmB [Candidatus Fimenecus sp.]
MIRDDDKKPDLLIGRNAVTEALKSDREIDTLILMRNNNNPALSRLASMAKEKGAVVKEVDSKKLDFMCGGANHQGVAAYVAAHEYASVEDIFAYAEEKGEAPFIVVCDEIEDPHNLGAIIRTAECAGVHGVIIPKRRSASLNFTVGKTSAGALEYMRVARVSNLASTIDELKEKGCWVYGADMDGTDYKKTDFSGAVVLVIGSEGKGIGKLIRQKCDAIVSLPMKGNINSLNASVAAGILMYEVSCGR